MQLPKDFIRYAHEWEAKINAFIEIHMTEGDISPSAALVSGLPFAVGDNIAVQNMSFSCGSKLLEKLRSPYTATAVQKLEAAGGLVIGKTNIDEFGMGVTGCSVFKQTGNPWDIGRTAGSGAAAAVAAGIVPYALEADSGASLRQPAAFCGVAGLKPTYGAVSRYGLAAYASSLENIGVLADTVERCRAVFAQISGSDPLDQSSRDAPATAPGITKRIGVLCHDQKRSLEDEVRRGFELAKERLSSLGYTLVDITIPALHYAVPAFYTIAAAEASANLARFDGIRFGARPAFAENPDELVEKAREAGFGAESK
jgi:aspartyl-tRNA(Asn)/glutamyl-tRNA(Gln) amidotransferase subunit A